jgi:hypothetical protein
MTLYLPQSGLQLRYLTNSVTGQGHYATETRLLVSEFANQLENRLKGVMASVSEASGYDSALEMSFSSEDDRASLEDQLAKAVQVQHMAETELSKYKSEQ